MVFPEYLLLYHLTFSYSSNPSLRLHKICIPLIAPFYHQYSESATVFICLFFLFNSTILQIRLQLKKKKTTPPRRLRPFGRGIGLHNIRGPLNICVTSAIVRRRRRSGSGFRRRRRCRFRCRRRCSCRCIIAGLRCRSRGWCRCRGRC